MVTKVARCRFLVPLWTECSVRNIEAGDELGEEELRNEIVGRCGVLFVVPLEFWLLQLPGGVKRFGGGKQRFGPGRRNCRAHAHPMPSQQSGAWTTGGPACCPPPRKPPTDQ